MFFNLVKEKEPEILPRKPLCDICDCSRCSSNYKNCNKLNGITGDCNGCQMCHKEGRAMPNLNCIGFSIPAR